jgi:large repetitive protein
MRRLGLRGVVTTALAALVIPLAGAAGASAASTSVWPSASALGLPSDASAVAAATTLPSVSCGSSTQCVAVGGYSGASATEPMTLTSTSGAWTGGSTIALPSGASSGSLESVSCTAAGTCTAVGQDDSNAHPIVAIETSGGWAGASELSSSGSLAGVSCLTGGNCSAVGTDGSGQPLAVTSVSGGAFSAATAPALPSGGTSGNLTSVACTTPGNCVAVGNYATGGQTEAMIATQTSGNWGAATLVALPTGAAASQNATLNSVSCPASGHCIAVGSYTNSAGQTAAMIDTQGSTQAAALGLPTGATASTLGSISCTSSTACTATGSVVAGSLSPLAATDSGGTWAAGTALPEPAGALPSGALSQLTLAVGCTAALQCQAAGTYPMPSGYGAMALNSHPSLVITSHSLPAGAIGTRYSAKIATSGGTGGNVWTMTGGSLPAGLTFNATSGTVSGTPTTNQTTTFSVSVHDNATPADEDSASLSITIGPQTKPAKPTTGKGGSSGKGSGKKSKKPKGAKVGQVKVLHGSSVRFTVKCLRQRHCDGRVAVVVVEHFRGKKLLAINASTHRARGTRTKTVWLGSYRYKLRSGKKVTRTIRLNRTGSRLLKTRHKLKAGVALRPARFKHATIEHTVKLHEPKAKKHGKHAKHKKHSTHKKKGTHST